MASLALVAAKDFETGGWFLKIRKMKLGREPNEKEKSPGLIVGSLFFLKKKKKGRDADVSCRSAGCGGSGLCREVHPAVARGAH